MELRRSTPTFIRVGAHIYRRGFPSLIVSFCRTRPASHEFCWTSINSPLSLSYVPGLPIVERFRLPVKVN